MTDRRVDAQGNIDRSVVITGDGNSAVLNFGDAFVLPLQRKQIVAPVRRQPNAQALPDLLSLLAPEAGKLPLVGRADLLAELQAWLDHDVDVSVDTLIARAGSGKTRLAVELCKQVDGDLKPGVTDWVAGFIRPSDLAAVADKLATTRFDWPPKTLLVIDYASAVHRPLADWLDRLASETFNAKLRLLLLEREAPDGFGWWHDLSRPSSISASSRRGLLANPDRPRALPNLDAGEGRRELLAATQVAARAMIGESASPIDFPALGENAQFDAALAAHRFGNPLNLAMAGIIAAQRGPAEAFGLRRLDAARRLAAHELGRIELIADGAKIDRQSARHALGFNNMCGGLALASLNGDLSKELALVGKPATTAALVEVLQQELPPSGATEEHGAALRLGTTQPDLIGEAVIIEALLNNSPVNHVAAPQLVQRAYALTGSRAAEALMRLVQDFGYAAEDGAANEEERKDGARILGLLTALAEAIPDEDIVALETLVAAMPANSLVLREAAAKQSARLARHWDIIAKATEAELARDRAAGWHNNLANRLSDLGQRELALAAAQEAVDLYRALAAARPDAFTPDLAMSLNNLANRLSELGQRELALAAAQEAVDLYRALAAARPDAFTPDLAGSLNNLASFLSALGQRETALAAAQEAVDLYRALAAARPDAFTPDLAMSLNNLANRLSELGERELALAAAQEAVDLRRALAAARPDAFTPDLAGSLNNLANRLGELGQRETALAAAQEAVDLYRALAAARPDAFTPNLATSLNTLANRVGDLGQRELALAAAQEAVDLRRALAAARPDAFTPDLAMSLNNLANCLSDLGQRELALAAAQEAVDLYRALAAARPDAFTPDLAMSLNNLANCLSDLGQRELALAATQEAVDLYRALAAARPDAFTPDLAMSLNNLANRLGELGQRETALAAAQEAVDLYRALAAARPDAFTPNLATSLSVLGDRLEEVERLAEAVEADHGSVSALQPHFLARPMVFAGAILAYLRDYVRRCEKAGVEPDHALLEPIFAVLAAMQSGEAQ